MSKGSRKGLLSLALGHADGVPPVVDGKVVAGVVSVKETNNLLSDCMSSILYSVCKRTSATLPCFLRSGLISPLRVGNVFAERFGLRRAWQVRILRPLRLLFERIRPRSMTLMRYTQRNLGQSQIAGRYARIRVRMT